MKKLGIKHELYVPGLNIVEFTDFADYTGEFDEFIYSVLKHNRKAGIVHGIEIINKRTTLKKLCKMYKVLMIDFTDFTVNLSAEDRDAFYKNEGEIDYFKALELIGKSGEAFEQTGTVCILLINNLAYFDDKYYWDLMDLCKTYISEETTRKESKFMVMKVKGHTPDPLNISYKKERITSKYYR